VFILVAGEDQKSLERERLRSAVLTAMSEVLDTSRFGVGVDLQIMEEIPADEPDFLVGNFTASEIDYCRKSPDIAASFTGRWAAKEAVIKAVMSRFPDAPNPTKGGGAPLIDIEILVSNSGAPRVILHGYAAEVAERLGIKEIKVSISHSGNYAVAVAMAG
jgi:fatty acid synthase subunit beta